MAAINPGQYAMSRRLADDLEVAETRIGELEAAVEWFFEMLDTNVFVRNIADDNQPDYHVRMLKLTVGLQKAKAVLKKDS